MYCTVCKKIRKTRIQISKPKYWYENYEKIKHLEYEREICERCQSVLILSEVPNFNTNLKEKKSEKKKRKLFEKNQKRLNDWLTTIGQ